MDKTHFSGLFRVLHLCWYDDLSSWLDKLTWQVDLTRYILSSDLKRGKRAGWQVNLSRQLDKLTSLSSGTCHRKCNLLPTKTICRRQPAKKLRIASVSEKVFARFFGHFFACSSLSKVSVFGWTRCEIWPWHNSPPTSFSRYKESRTFCSQGQQS